MRQGTLISWRGRVKKSRGTKPRNKSHRFFHSGVNASLVWLTTAAFWMESLRPVRRKHCGLSALHLGIAPLSQPAASSLQFKILYLPTDRVGPCQQHPWALCPTEQVVGPFLHSTEKGGNPETLPASHWLRAPLSRAHAGLAPGKLACFRNRKYAKAATTGNVWSETSKSSRSWMTDRWFANPASAHRTRGTREPVRATSVTTWGVLHLWHMRLAYSLSHSGGVHVCGTACLGDWGIASGSSRSRSANTQGWTNGMTWACSFFSISA
jgi:hypothetical protein